MPVKTSAVPPEVFQLKATLLGTMAEIWRRVGISTVVSDGPREPLAHGFTWSSSHESEHAWRRSGKDAENIIAVRLG